MLLKARACSLSVQRRDSEGGWRGFKEWAVKPRFYKDEVFKGLVTSDGNASGLVPTTNHQEEGTP